MAKAKETKEVVEIQLTKILPDPNNTRSQINEVADNELAFKKNLEAALNEPGVILISKSNDDSKYFIELMKTLEGVYDNSQFSEEGEPTHNDRSYFEGFDTEEEDEAAYQEAFVEYNEEMKQFNESIEKGEFLKAFWINGNDKGEFTYVSLNKNAKI